MTAYTYLLRCRDGSLYGGWTTDLESRIAAHNQGNGAKYTRGRGPVTLAYHEEFDTKQAAQAREYAIKRLTKREKEALAAAYAKKE
ncbi:GIY-YIG nuclease family protein [Azotosporobacter soli]|uniref:GIY-YIG nuclease family protein n=1 Tax=Azotosporobacter soli TaxID=3055040 RepID=UPI0031FE8DBD